MPALTPRQQRRIQRTRELLDIAEQILLEEGVDALTMVHLARRASAGVGALYRYFPSKDDLVAALHGRISGLCQPTYVVDIPGGHGKTRAHSAVAETDNGNWYLKDFRNRSHRYSDE